MLCYSNGTDKNVILQRSYHTNAVNILFCNFNKKHLILAKLCINNAPSMDNQNAKFQLNLLKQTLITVVYVRWPQSTSVFFVNYVGHKRPETEVFQGNLTKITVTIVCFNRFAWRFAVLLPINNALLIRNYARIGCFLLELRKCTLIAGFTYVTPDFNS